MEEFINNEFYGNTVGNWAIAFVIIAASILLSKVVFYLIGRFVKQLTKKTKSKLDDIIIDKIEEPVVFAIIIIGIWYGLKVLNISDSFSSLIIHAYYLLITFNLAWFATRLMDGLIEEYLVPLVEESETDLDDQLLPIARKVVKIVIWTMAIIIGLNNAGYNVGTIIAGLGIGGLAFALAAKDSLSHLFGGFVLFTDKPFAIKDRILTNGYDGVVSEIGIRSTRITTLDGREVVIPNADIANNSIVNISSEPNRKITVDIGLTYDTNIIQMKKAMELLQKITVDNQGVEENKTVTAFTAFGDFSLNIRFIYYIKKGEAIFDVMTSINLEVLKKFNENNLDFAFPTQTIYNLKQ